jgi:CheY-like chemotaxis protein
MTEKKMILIIEDDAFISRAYTHKFKAEGYIVHSAANGEEGFTLLKKHKPNLVLLDLIMPVMDGYDFLEAKSKDKSVADIAVVVLTNLGQQEDEEKVKSYGVKDFYVKADTSFIEIMEIVKKYIK